MSRGRRSKKKNRNKIDLQVVVLIVASILLAVLIYAKSGYIGETLSPILGRSYGMDKVHNTNWNICNGNIYSL